MIFVNLLMKVGLELIQSRELLVQEQESVWSKREKAEEKVKVREQVHLMQEILVRTDG